jgi:hypothetical protein
MVAASIRVNPCSSVARDVFEQVVYRFCVVLEADAEDWAQDWRVGGLIL